MTLRSRLLAEKHSAQDVARSSTGMENKSADFVQNVPLKVATYTGAPERQPVDVGKDETTEAILVLAVSLSIVAVMFVAGCWYVRVRKKARTQRTEKVPLSSTEERLPLERLLAPPPIITMRELRLLREEWQSLVTAAGGLASLWPKVFLSCAIGSRPRDASGGGPGLFYAAALTKFLYQRGISCLGGDDGKVLGEYGTHLLGTEGQLSARAAECKVLVVIETTALYESVVCLQEIYVAQKAGVEIILARFERDAPCVDKRWSTASIDPKYSEMVDKVRAVLDSVEPIPERPGTIPDSQAELANVLRAIDEIILETRQNLLQGDECGNKDPSASESLSFGECKTSVNANALMTQSLPGRWGSSRGGSVSCSLGIPQVRHSPIAINVVAASDAVANFQGQRSAPLTDGTFSMKVRFAVPPSTSLQPPESPRSCADLTDSDVGSSSSRRADSIPLREARSSRKTLTAPARMKRAKPLRRHDAPKGCELTSKDEQVLSSAISDPVRGKHGSTPKERFQRTANLLKLPKKTPQDGTNKRKSRKMCTFQENHELQVQAGLRSRNNGEQLSRASSPPQVADLCTSAENSEFDMASDSPRSAVQQVSKLGASSELERQCRLPGKGAEMVVQTPPWAMTAALSEPAMTEQMSESSKYFSEGGMSDITASCDSLRWATSEGAESPVQGVVAPKALDLHRSSITARQESSESVVQDCGRSGIEGNSSFVRLPSPRILPRESSAVVGTQLTVASSPSESSPRKIKKADSESSPRKIKKKACIVPPGK